MKVGILTFHRGPNYGGFLQAWSLREEIRGLGYEAEVINYKNPVHYASEIHRLRLGLRLISVWANYRKHRMWERVYPELSDEPLATDPVNIKWASYDAVIVGSDVVWDYQTPKFGRDPLYFGIAPGSGPGRWIAYAASCGRAPVDGLPQPMVESLEKFAAIGVRDKGTKALVRNATGFDAEIVVDPTWLSDRGREPTGDGTRPELAFYGYAGLKPNMIEAIQRFARRHRLRTVSYGFYKGWADENRLTLEPKEWVEALRSARCVVTGTFHGTLYSIRLGKPFCVVGNDWISNKIRSPLDLVEAPGRLVTTPDALAMELESQFENGVPDLYARAQPARDASKDFLRRALSG